MTENLKSVRLLHNLLILVCAAIIVFATTPDRARRYSAAANELDQYSQLSSNDYFRYVYSSLKPDELKEKERMVELLRQNGYDVSNDVSFTVPMWANPIGAGGSPGNFCKSVQQKQTVTFARAVADYSGPLIPLSSPKSAVQPNAQGIVTAIFLGSGPDMNSTPQFQLLNGSPTGFPVSSSLILSIRGQGGEQKLSSLRIAYISGSSKTGYFGEEWLKTLGYASHMIEGSRCLPYSLQVFPEIEGMHPGDALRYLALQREAEKKNDLEVSSLRIDSATVGATAPIILGLLLVFFISQVRHLRFISTKLVSAKDYPWVGLFDDWLGKLIAYSTIVFLPVLSEILMTRRVGPSSFGLRFGPSVGIALLSFWAGLELWRVRKLVRAHRSLID